MISKTTRPISGRAQVWSSWLQDSYCGFDIPLNPRFSLSSLTSKSTRLFPQPTSLPNKADPPSFSQWPGWHRQVSWAHFALFHLLLLPHPPPQFHPLLNTISDVIFFPFNAILYINTTLLDYCPRSHYPLSYNIQWLPIADEIAPKCLYLLLKSPIYFS